DEVGVKPGSAGRGNQLRQVGALQRFATGKTYVQHPQVRRLVQYPLPIFSWELVRRGSQLKRVRTVRAMQKAAVGDFGQQTIRPGHIDGIGLASSSPSRSSRLSANNRFMKSE